MDDPDAPATDDERARAERLRLELEPSGEGPDAELARALCAAWNPRDLPSAAHVELVARAVRSRRGRVLRLSVSAGALVALAAGVLLVLRPSPGDRPSVVGPAPALSRSTQALFHEKFATLGGESGRIDTIALARASDLRDNEFARWGVR